MNREQTDPPLSVVVVILGGQEYLPRCLDALASQTGTPDFELLVPHDASLRDVDAIRDAFPDVQLIAHSGRRTYAELRAAGFRRARGRVIALTEDHCTPREDWCANILRLHADGHRLVGGAVDKSGRDTAVNWAIYLNDFSRYMNPVPRGPATYLTDCNVSYDREVLQQVEDLWREEFHETTVHWALMSQGIQLWLSPDVVVHQQRSLELGPAIRERYEFGRLFASTRVAGAALPRRLLYAALAFALPPILVGRVARNVFGKRRAVGRFFRVLPLLALLTSVWAWGECLGYLTAKPSGRLAESGSQRLKATA